MNLKKALFTATLSALALTTASPAMAAQTPNCAQIYGGANSCIQTDPLVINNQVQNPDTNEYTDNLTTNDPSYNAGDTVLFKITVSNNGNTALKQVAVKNVLPQYVDFSKGQGNYNKASRTLSFTIDELKSKENKVYFIEGKVVAENNLPDKQRLICVINQAEISEGNRVSRDNARVCIANANAAETAPVAATPTKAANRPTPTPTKAAATKGGTKIYPPTEKKATPETGPEAFALIGLAPLGGLGLWLKRRANK